MTATGHALIGTVIAAKIGNPALAIPIAIGSHFLADTLPHWDTGTNRIKKTHARFFVESLADLIIGFILSWLLITLFFPSTSLPYAFLIIIMAQLPDWITAPYLFLNWNFSPFSTMYNIQKKFDKELDAPWGVINQVIVLTVIVLIAKIF